MMDHSKREAWLWGILLACAIMLAGCNQVITPSPGTAKPKPAFYTGKQGPMLEKLDKRFQNSDTHFELGQSYRAEGNRAKAKYHFDIAIRFDPTNRPAQAALTKVLIDGGERSEADVGAKRYMS
ncbi:MAG: tetratricopeptide repeat protein, partial [Planctomycetota bacterium]